MVNIDRACKDRFRTYPRLVGEGAGFGNCILRTVALISASAVHGDVGREDSRGSAVLLPGLRTAKLNGDTKSPKAGSSNHWFTTSSLQLRSACAGKQGRLECETADAVCHQHALSRNTVYLKPKYTLRASLSGTFLQTLPLNGHSISAQLSTDAVSALRKVWVLIRLWKQHSVQAYT